MRAECINAVEQAIGRALKPGEADGIEKRILGNMQMIARDDPKSWAGMSKTERYTAAADAAAKQLQADAQLKANRLALNITARAKLAQRFNDGVASGVTGANTVERILNQTDAYIKGVQRENFSRLMDTINAAEPRFFGLADNPKATSDFVREVFGADSGSEIAKKGAKAWLETIESMRQRFNRAGGDVGKLDYGYIPQTHDQATVLRNGMDKWREIIAPLLDRSRYVDDAGNPLGDAEFMDMLDSAWQTIATGGLNKLDPSKQTFGTSFANRGSQSRQLHFKDADAWLKYNELYGRGTLFEAMQNHVTGIGRNIGVIEEMGPNPRAGFDMLQKMAVKSDGRQMSVGAGFAELDALYKVMTGENNQAANPNMAQINQDIRNITVAAKLQGTLLSSVTDIPTLMATAQYHQLPIFRTLGNVIKSFGSGYKEYANVNGLVSESIISDMTRWADGNMSNGLTSKLASATMKVQFLNAWTDALKRGFQISMMGALGKIHGNTWETMQAADRARLEFQGVTPEIYNVWAQAKPEQWRGSSMLTPDAIRAIPDAALESMGNPGDLRDKAVSRLLGFIIDESEYAVTTPDLTTRASLGGALQKGTAWGEFARHATLFKSFPLAMANRHMRRASAMNGETGNIGYAVSLMVGLIGFGALAVQLKSLASGQDPADMTTPKFWGKAMAQGGGLGIYGDLLYTGLGGQSRSGQPNYAGFAGPVLGTAADYANITLGNLGEVIRGEKTDAGAEIVRFTKQNTPFINLWYAKAAIDHLALQDLQESLSPGYLSRMRQRAYQDYGQRYWWEPGQTLPARAPDMANAIGE